MFIICLFFKIDNFLYLLGRDTFKAVLLTATLCPGFASAVTLFINIIAVYYSSSRAIPFLVIVSLKLFFCLGHLYFFFSVSSPYHMIIVGDASHMVVLSDPVNHAWCRSSE